MPLCPRGHGSRQIVFGGRYGQGLGKQLYKCYPADGSRPHRFAPLLPRQGMPEHTCWECENPIYAHEGPRTARAFQWPLRTVVQALGRVAAGETYVGAARRVRDLPVRDRGTLVADWVEAYTDALWAALGPRQWPQFLVADTKTFEVRDWSQRADLTRPPKAGERLPSVAAFTLIVIVGADAPPYPTSSANWSWMPVYAHVVPGQSVKWLDFAYLFSLLPGTPQGFTADHGNGILNAASAWWPGIELSASIHHARKGFINAVPPLIWTRYGPQTQAIADTLESLLDSWTQSPADMQAFLDFAAKKTGQYQPVKAWLNAVIGGAGANQGLQGLRGIKRRDLLLQMASRTYPHGPHSNSAAEDTLRSIASTWGSRVYSFRNAERTNRLLKLMVLHRRRAYDEQRWTAVLTEALTCQHGRPAQPLRSISDRNKPSLRP